MIVPGPLGRGQITAALPLSSTYVVEAAGEGIKSTSDAVSAKGVKNHGTYTANFDGKTYPVVGSGPLSSIALTRVNSNSFTAIANGKTDTRNVTTVISADGKTRTSTAISKNADGTTVTMTGVYDKQ